MKKTVLVTGGTGYIGSHTVVELINQNYEVIIVDDLSNSKLSVLDGIQGITDVKPVFEKVDLSDAKSCEKFFEQYPNIDAVIHFAASKAVGESVEQPLKYYKNNLYSLINVLEGMKKHNIPHLVFSSSCTVYGEAKELPVNEQTPIQKANSPYGNTKQIAEEIIADFLYTQTNYQAIALRYFNPIGAHESALIGELPNGVPNNLVPFITQTAAGLREELSVFGGDYATPDGTAIRDYIHVVDLAQAHIAALERLDSGNQEEALDFINIGTGKGSSVLECIQSFERANNVKLNYTIKDRREGDVEQIWANTEKAKQVLNWSSKLSLDDAMKTAWKWQLSLDA